MRIHCAEILTSLVVTVTQILAVMTYSRLVLALLLGFFVIISNDGAFMQKMRKIVLTEHPKITRRFSRTDRKMAQNEHR
jgi:uncharacterized protein (DUF58 family)